MSHLEEWSLKNHWKAILEQGLDGRMESERDLKWSSLYLKPEYHHMEVTLGESTLNNQFHTFHIILYVSISETILF